MDTTGLRTIIAKRFGETIVDVKPQIFKVAGRFNQKQFATYYFDCSDSFLKNDFDIMDYQKVLLADDYYESEGPLQWNFYLYFVTENRNIPKEVKSRIESNKAFTRKLVASSEELIKIIEIQSKLREQQKGKLDGALISVWKNKLKGAGLSGIYLTKDYPKINDVFQMYVENMPFKEVVEEDRTVSANEIQTGTLAALDLEGFRSFPNAERFAFKKVNLIRGVNGTGKTSILEGIELCICGQTIENGSKREPATKLEISYSTGASDKYAPDDTKKFQARDRSWYGNNTLRGNTLSQGFHVYNFFDSDAAYRFTMESNTGEAVRQIFSRIILGEQTNLIFDRIERFNDKLYNQFKQINTLYKEKSDERLSYQAKLNEVDASSQVISTLGEIISLLDELKWGGVNLLLSEGTNRQQFQGQFSKVSTFFSGLDSISWIDPLTINSIRREQSGLTKAIEDLEELTTREKVLKQQIQELTIIKGVIEKQSSILKISEKYFNEREIQEVSGLKSKLIRSRANFSLTERLKSIVSIIQARKDLSINELLITINLEADLLKKELDNLSLQSEKIKNSISQLNKLKTDLKTIGAEYVRVSGDSHTCPLCDTKFPNENLLSIITTLEGQIKDNEEIFQISAAQKVKSNRSVEIDQDLQLLKTIEQEFSHANDLNIVDYKTLSIENLSKKLDDLLKTFENERIRLEVIDRRFSDAGISEFEFSSFNSSIKSSGLDIMIGGASQEKYLQKLKELELSQIEIADRDSVLKQSLSDLEILSARTVAQYLNQRQLEGSSAIQTLTQTLDTLSRTVRLFDDLKGVISVPEGESLTAARAKVSLIEGLLTKYFQIENQNKLRNEYQQQLESLKGSIVELEKSKDRMGKAKVALDEIVNVNNRENYLREFFADNKQSILDVFRALHLPNEFDDIRFESSDAIKLKVKNSNEFRDLSEISTGQKSAFILSLFLTLNNNLQSGPPLIIFDDPIAYVDDINTLSFLDFLRDRAIMTNRQIFFATANSKLANLFQQKFDFLGEDLKVINLNSDLPANR
jgi:DNA repair exonuclease SbcCD ATPase subunit